MAGDEGKSLRRRFTTSIKRALSYKSRKSSTEIATSPSSPSVPITLAGPATPAVREAPEAADTAAPVKSQPAVTTTATPTPVHVPRTARAPSVLSTAERAQALFKKHGLDVKPSEWPAPKPPGERIQKDIRMRVHRTCHKCETTYGADKTCLQCGHKRCKRCPRYPVKKSKDKGKEKLTAKAPGYKKRRGDIMYGLTIPAKKGGQDLVHKPPRQRIHRKCHRCETEFQNEKVCSKCSHTRCKLCPRDPFKPHKAEIYASYDPDDSDAEVPPPRGPPRRTFKRPRRRIHWTCSKCTTTFTEKNKICLGCGSNRDDTGIRDPPKKPKIQPTEEELQRLNDRLKETSIST